MKNGVYRIQKRFMGIIGLSNLNHILKNYDEKNDENKLLEHGLLGWFVTLSENKPTHILGKLCALFLLK